MFSSTKIFSILKRSRYFSGIFFVLTIKQIKNETESPSERGEVYGSTAPTARTPLRFQSMRDDDSVSNENISQNDKDDNTTKN